MNCADFKETGFWIRLGCGLWVALFIIERLTTLNADADLWGYLSFGRLLWNTRHFPYQDVFSYLPTINLWVYHEWLTGVLFYPIYQSLGFAGLQFLKYTFGLTTMAMIYLTARKRGGLPLASVLFIVLIMRGFIYIGYNPVRAQVFTFFFFALTLYFLETARLTRAWRPLWLLIPIQILWCNLHGGFLAGLGLVALYALGEAFSRRPYRPYLWVLALSGLATLLNPYGMQYWYYLIQAISIPRPQIIEWFSIYKLYRSGLISSKSVLNLSIMVILVLFLAWRNRWREQTPILCLGLTLYLGLIHIRHIVFFYLLLGAYLPVLLNPYLAELKSHSKFAAAWDRLPRALGLTLALIMVLNIFWAYQFFQKGPFSLYIPALPAKANDIPGNFYPVEAVKYILRNNLSGKLFTEFAWGEYLIWTLYPRCRVGLDGRYETVYPEELAKEYFAVITGEVDWRPFLDRHPPDLILIDSRSLFCRRLRGAPDWQEIFADGSSALFRRY